MKYDELNALMIEFDRLRLDADRVIRKLRALGVTDLPGDAPRCLGTHAAPGNLPGEPTEEMVQAGRRVGLPADASGVWGTEMVRDILRAALAAAPRVEVPDVPEVTEEDAQALCRASWGWAEDRHVSIPDTQATLVGLRAVRARLIARMGAQS